MAGIAKKKILRIVFETTSPLAIGSGADINTDNDVLLNSNGKPFIPGSAMAGVILSHIKEQFDKQDVSWHDYFGFVEINSENKENPEIKESRLSFSDAELLADTFHITRRDFVALDEFKSAKKGAKFDIEVVEPGVRFAAVIQQDFVTDHDEDYIERILNIFRNEEVSFGMKTSRGMGRVKLTEAGVKEFSFTSKEDIKEWLTFEPSAMDMSESCEMDKGAGMPYQVISLGLELQGGISIRRYTTEANDDDNRKSGENAVPDYEQLTEHVGEDVYPVIPGTSWAGAFIHQMKRNVPGCDTIEIVTKTKKGEKKKETLHFFGLVNEKTKEKARSYVEFSEMIINGGTTKTTTRNAIDRFSGGTVNGALFTEKTHYGGTGTLTITLKKLRSGKYSKTFWLFCSDNGCGRHQEANAAALFFSSRRCFPAF